MSKISLKPLKLAAMTWLGLSAGLSFWSVAHAQVGTNDPLSAQQWNLNVIRAPQAWALAPATGEKVRIAVIDTGYSGHPEINWAKNGAGKDLYLAGGAEGNNGNDSAYLDSYTHGTHVAGILAARTGNGEGTSGVCPQCEVLSIKTDLSDANLAHAIRLAVQSGAKVINLSLSAANQTCDNFQYTKRAIASASAAGLSVVAAAGNHNTPEVEYDVSDLPTSAVDVTTVFPASCPGVISVGASVGTTQYSNVAAPYTNGGPSLTLMAPGGAATAEDGLYGAGLGACSLVTNVKFDVSTTRVGVLSAWSLGTGTQWQHCYRYLSGTSMATPHVSGVIGLMLSANPALSPLQIKDILRRTTTPMNCANQMCGAGLLNAEAAVVAARSISGNATVTGACRYNFGDAALQPAACSLGTMSESPGGTETVTAYGNAWTFDAQGQPLDLPLPLSSYARYASAGGPCSSQYVASTDVCEFETRAEVDYPGVGYLESITAYGRYWNFDANGNPFGPQGESLSTVARYAAAGGPCFNKPICRFGTRVLVNFPEYGGLVESVSAYGNYWLWDASGKLLASGPLESVARYGVICQYKSPWQPCEFTTRELRSNRHEVITAYGRYFEFNGETLLTSALLETMNKFD
ncbi:S8 family serine peptidase [Xanthomonas campestris]|uniref:S8 family peptidase n=1 Tax=Xanthomonas campestris TaxID=339 RepID=UPI0011C43AC9|nr:S8 family serine peptidase [Xanthomonas campestris]